MELSTLSPKVIFCFSNKLLNLTLKVIFLCCRCCWSSGFFVRAKRQAFFCRRVCFLPSFFFFHFQFWLFCLICVTRLDTCEWHASLVLGLGRFIQQKLSCPSISEYEKLQAEFSDLQIKYNDLLAAHHKTCKEVPFFTFTFYSARLFVYCKYL